MALKFAFTIQQDNEEDQKVKYQPSSTKNFDKIDILSSQADYKNNKSKKKKNAKESEKGKKDVKNDTSKKANEKVSIVVNTDTKPPQEEEKNVVSPEKIVKPVFKYIPYDDLMKEMINKLIDEMMVHERRKRKKTTKKLTMSSSIKIDTDENEETSTLTAVPGGKAFDFEEESKG